MYYEFVMAFIITCNICILFRHIEKSYLRQLLLRIRRTNFTLLTKLMDNLIYICWCKIRQILKTIASLSL